MAGSVNKVILIGNLGADPEIRSFQNGGRIATFRIATSESWKDRQTGEKKERTEWHTIQCGSDGLVGVIERFLKKGSKVYVEGQLRTRKWQDQSGNDRYSTEVFIGMNGSITMLDGANRDGQQGGSNGGGESSGYGGGAKGGWGQGSGNAGGGGWNTGGGSQTSQGGGGGWNQGGGFGDDLDDDNPF